MSVLGNRHSVCPGRGAAWNDALQTRDPGFFPKAVTGVPHLRCTASALHRVRDTRNAD